jgi:hypothetical protein
MMSNPVLSSSPEILRRSKSPLTRKLQGASFQMDANQAGVVVELNDRFTYDTIQYKATSERLDTACFYSVLGCSWGPRRPQ